MRERRKLITSLPFGGSLLLIMLVTFAFVSATATSSKSASSKRCSEEDTLELIRAFHEQFNQQQQQSMLASPALAREIAAKQRRFSSDASGREEGSCLGGSDLTDIDQDLKRLRQ